MHPAIEMLTTTHQPRADRLGALTERLGRRDGYEAEHMEAVSRLAVAIGIQLGLSDEELAEVELGGLLHDVGKLDVPEAILSKGASLDELEWRTMRAHAESGERLLHDVVALPGVLAVVRSHHERWDGGGYPDGTRGEAIPLAARVVAVADAFQAMIEPRPYRGRRSQHTSLAEIRRNAGSQFDPYCVAALAAVVLH
jgi:HD-GYP domain-containing protein (c-di-GMP phosphodiesterase class II)